MKINENLDLASQRSTIMDNSEVISIVSNRLRNKRQNSVIRTLNFGDLTGLLEVFIIRAPVDSLYRAPLLLVRHEKAEVFCAGETHAHQGYDQKVATHAARHSLTAMLC